jgi:hypothetical protein
MGHPVLSQLRHIGMGHVEGEDGPNGPSLSFATAISIFRVGRAWVVVVFCCAAFGLPNAALADNWFPHPDDATWTYQWGDSVYSSSPTKEDLTVSSNKGKSFTLDWTSKDEDNPPDAAVSTGSMSFQETTAGLFNTGWSSSPPPPEFPILCSKAAGCNNTIGAALHLLIWGSRGPVLAEPLLNGITWDSSGGASGDVTSSSEYISAASVTVPAFPMPVMAAKVRSEITQAGALGDPFGSGVRTVWWVYGVGPVKIVFDHTGNPTTTATLLETNQTPQPPPPDENYFPLQKGLTTTFKWTNPKYFKAPVVERFHVDAVVNNSASVAVKSVSGPINTAGAYGFTLRTDGLTCVWGRTRSATTATLPKLGPGDLPVANRRHFFTPYDLMTYGFNPLFTAYPSAGDTWKNDGTGRDFSIYGVTGTTTVVGIESVTVPAGTYKTALKVKSTLKQDGFPFGSGTRTAWFAPDIGLVKLVFEHADDSTSTVVLTKVVQPS